MFYDKLKYCLAIGGVILFWVMATPIFEFPDEQAHFGSVEYLVGQGSMPAYDALDMSQEMYQTQELLGVLRNSQGQNKYTYHPEYRLAYSHTTTGIFEDQISAFNTINLRNNLVATEAARYPHAYYTYSSWWYHLAESQDIFVRVFVVRLGGVALASVMAYFVYHIGLVLFAKKNLSYLLTLLVMLQPMHSFLLAGINSDNLHNLLFTVVIYLGLLIVQQGAKLPLLLASTLVIYLDILTKPQGYLAIPIMVLAYTVHVIAWKKWHQLGQLLILAVLAISAIIFLPNPYLGWLTRPNQSSTSIVEYISFSLNKLVAQNIVWYWGVFKWLGVVLPPIYWQIANRLVLLSVVGLLVYTWKKLQKLALPTNCSNVVFLLLATALYALAIYYFDYQYVRSVGYSIGVQARYFFPTIVAHMALLLIGLLSLTWKERQKSWVLRGLTVFIIWIQLGGVWRLVTSYYDTHSLSVFITQASQYKPDFAKGEWWYLYLVLYLLSLLYLTYLTLKQESLRKP